jgi:hypothetical protein
LPHAIAAPATGIDRGLKTSDPPGGDVTGRV